MTTKRKGPGGSKPPAAGVARPPVTRPTGPARTTTGIPPRPVPKPGATKGLKERASNAAAGRGRRVKNQQWSAG
jgi:hypothetical protein